VIIAEVGLDMTRFPTPAHLSSWARFAPGVKESAGRKKGTAATGHGDRYLARVLGEAAVSAARTNTFLGKRYRRIARRRGKKKAIVAVGPFHPAHHLVHTLRPRNPLLRPGPRLLRLTHQPRP
jgi:transposase